jgi:hypothetical protein
MASVTLPVFSIIGRGQCIDGWFSSYIAHTFLKTLGTVNMYFICPNLEHTHPHTDKLKGTNVLLVDISVDSKIQNKWMKAGVLSIDVIDHHANTQEHWPNLQIDTTRCSALQVWQKCYPTSPIPPFLFSIDRIDRWDNPTFEDRCLREILKIIANKTMENKVDEAFSLTQSFMNMLNDPAEMASTMEGGRAILEKKDKELMALMDQKGRVITVTQEHINAWKIPSHWLGANLFILDNTNIVIDTNEAAHLVFTNIPTVNAFINYRRKKSFGRGPGAKEKMLMVYCARSRNGFDMTVGTCLKGNPNSCGASLTIEDNVTLPFVVS